jgi:hypothetical protein
MRGMGCALYIRCALSIHKKECRNSLEWALYIGARYLPENTVFNYGPGSSAGIATDYGLDGLGIESRWGRDFSHSSRPALGAHPASCTMGTESFLGVKRPGRGADHPPPS